MNTRRSEIKGSAKLDSNVDRKYQRQSSIDQFMNRDKVTAHPNLDTELHTAAVADSETVQNATPTIVL